MRQHPPTAPTLRSISRSGTARTSTAAPASPGRRVSTVLVETLLDRCGGLALPASNTFEHEPTYLLHGLVRLTGTPLPGPTSPAEVK